MDFEVNTQRLKEACGTLQHLVTDFGSFSPVLQKLGMTEARRAIVNGRPLLYYELNAPG